MRHPIYNYIIRLGDDALILGKGLSAWCGRAAAQSLDFSLSSLALDLVGQATYWFELAAKYDPAGRDADALAFHRAANDYYNCLLVEQPNGDFAQTLARQFLFSQYQYLFLEALKGSSDTYLADTAAECMQDMAHHVDFTREWMIRLGDGDCVNHQRLLKSMDYMYHFVDELFVMDEIDEVLLGQNISIDKTALRPAFDTRVANILAEAGLTPPKAQRAVMLGRRGHHHQHVAHMLHDMRIPADVTDTRA